jgi:tRNA A37 methylthiotransferase MiaB
MEYEPLHVSACSEHTRAVLKIQEGCRNRCAYCIIPSVRGPIRSRRPDDIREEARRLADAGFREIVITGCNLCLYHNNGKRLAELISALAEIESPGHRIRLGSIEPGICDTALLDAIEAHPNICRFLHLSLQSGSDRILRLMRRPYTIGHVAEFCADARRRFGARLAIGADVITGFPGETEADFKATKSFLYSPMRTEARLHDIPLRRDGAIAPYPSRSTAQLSTHSSAMGSSRPTDPLSTLNSQLSTINYLHVFPYSEREGTEAASMAPSVPVETRRRRAKELEEIGASNREAFARSFIGKGVEVCIERDGSGYSGEYLHCILDAAAPRRSLAKVMVTDYFPKTRSLFATIRA